MPDWTYQTLFRPLLFQLPAVWARELTLRAMGRLAKLPGGSFIIKTLGHMESYPILASKLGGVELQYPVGFSGSLDRKGTAWRALMHLGFGFIETGPVTLEEPSVNRRDVKRDVDKEALIYEDEGLSTGLNSMLEVLRANNSNHMLPLMLRVRPRAGCSPEEALQEMTLLVDQLSPYAAGFYIDCLSAEWSIGETAMVLGQMLEEGKRLEPVKPALIYVPLHYPKDRLQELLIRDKGPRLGRYCSR